MAAIDPTAFTGATTLTATTGCTIDGTMNFTNVTIDRQDKNEARFTANFESDGACNITWDETGTASHISGEGGAITLPSGLNVDADGWSASVNVDTTVYSTFASSWKNSKITNAQVTGTVTGVVQFDGANTQPVPNA